MQCVILAAGRGTRMGGLTDSVPKPLLEVVGKTLLEHKFEVLPIEITDIVLVVGHLGDMIRERYGEEYNDRHITYVEQKNPVGGTAEALWLARPLLEKKFLVMNGDNIYAAEDMKSCIAEEWAVLVEEMESVRTGRVEVNERGCITGIAENTTHVGGRGYANTGLYVMDTRIFDYTPTPKAAGSTELGLPQTLMQAASDFCIKAVPATFWIEIKEADDLKNAEEVVRSRGFLK